ncbi:MAG: cytochrome c3 family protein [Thermodesulfobacteriota bacterium]
MKKPFFVMVMCALLVGAFCLPAIFAADAPKGDMELKVPAGATATKAPVKFSHEKHKAVDCKGCHHKESKDMKCSGAGCHDNLDPADKTSDKSFYMAFHKGDSKKSCVGCHKEAKAGGKNAPIACNACHPQAK